ncbi:SHOCT domain-containing protein [Lactiplantibacillus plantarum]
MHELKHLLDDDVITQYDFDAKKRQILGLQPK